MPTLIPLDDLLGVEFIGVILSTVVYGITCLQVYLYYTCHCGGDGLFTRLYVGAVWLIDSLHVALLVTAYYWYTVTNFGDYTVLAADTWSLAVSVTIGELLSGLVQCFFAMRVYKLSERQLPIPIAAFILSATQVACGIGYAVDGFRDRSSAAPKNALAFTISGLSAGIACDSLIAASIIYYLQIRRTIFPRTNRAINLLITYALNTCLLTTVFTAITLALWVKLDSSLVFTVFYFTLVRLYSCSLMSTLNSRGNLREALDGRTVELVGLQSTTAMTSANSESTVRTPGGGAWGKQSSSAPAYYEMDIDGGQKDSTNV